jgi:hypothetical protein
MLASRVAASGAACPSSETRSHNPMVCASEACSRRHPQSNLRGNIATRMSLLRTSIKKHSQKIKPEKQSFGVRLADSKLHLCLPKSFMGEFETLENFAPLQSNHAFWLMWHALGSFFLAKQSDSRDYIPSHSNRVLLLSPEYRKCASIRREPPIANNSNQQSEKSARL